MSDGVVTAEITVIGAVVVISLVRVRSFTLVMTICLYLVDVAVDVTCNVSVRTDVTISLLNRVLVDVDMITLGTNIVVGCNFVTNDTEVSRSDSTMVLVFGLITLVVVSTDVTIKVEEMVLGRIFVETLVTVAVLVSESVTVT